jgi:RNA polymerase sigma factor (sigma-70 family)
LYFYPSKLIILVLPKGNYNDEELAWFREVFDEHYEGIRNFAYFKTGDTQLADDIVQDSFLKLWAISQKVKRDSVKPLLYSIASNIIRKKIKFKKAVYKFSRLIPSNPTSQSHDSIILTTEIQSKLENAIAQIPENTRMVFLMSSIERVNYNEIAHRLNLSIKTIDKRMSEALKVLKSIMNYKA